MAEPPGEIHPGLPSELSSGDPDVRLTNLRVVLGEILVHDLAVAPGELQDLLGELEDRHLSRVADVHRIVHVALVEEEDALDQVVHVAERAGLAAVSEHRQGLPREGLLDEGGDHPAVPGAHPGTVGVEDAHDPGVETVESVVGHDHGLGESLGLVVDAPGPDGIHVAPVGLGLGVDERVPVHFGGRGEEVPGPVCLGQGCCACRAIPP